MRIKLAWALAYKGMDFITKNLGEQKLKNFLSSVQPVVNLDIDNYIDILNE